MEKEEYKRYYAIVYYTKYNNNDTFIYKCVKSPAMLILYWKKKKASHIDFYIKKPNSDNKEYIYTIDLNE